MIRYSTLLIIITFASCNERKQVGGNSSLPQVIHLPSIAGKENYLQSPFATAGNRVYMVGNQDGSFSDLGWHIQGEMGGVWDHPIKLLDGFTASLRVVANGNSYCLDSGMRFINYPVGNEHHFAWKQENIDIQRFQFVPDDMEGLVVQYKLVNKNAGPKKVTFCFEAKSDLRPTWLADSVKIADGKDEVRFDEERSALVFRDRDNPWFAVVGSKLPNVYNGTTGSCSNPHTADNGASGSLCVELTLKANSESSVPVYIAGSYESEVEATSTLGSLRSNASQYLTNKMERFREIARRTSIDIPDAGLAEMFTWMKFNTDWLIREVPSEGVGLSAGLPDYPWWFGADATYSLQGVLATGDHKLVRSTILLLNNISKRTNNNGRIIHEVSTNGVVYNRGNVNETAQFVTLVYNYLQWTGDVQLVKDIFPDLKKGIEWLLTTKDPDDNGYPNGSGMMEIPGLESDLELIDVAVYTQQALSSAAVLATAAGDDALARQYGDRAEVLRRKINDEWWVNEQRSYGDFRSTSEEGTHILKAALIRSDTMKKAESVRTLKALEKGLRENPVRGTRTFLIYNNWVVNTPMETGIATREHALKALASAERFQNAFGLFVTGIDKTDEPDSVVLASRRKIFSYTGAVMTLPTGVIAVGAARYGQIDQALRSMKKLERSFSYALPGSMYEVSPDFGMITQAWNIYGVAVPIVSGIFGIQPDAPHKTTRITPKLPTAWDHAAVQEVHVGDNLIGITIKRDGEFLDCDIQQSQGDWNIEVDAKAVSATNNDNAGSGVANGTQKLKGKKISVRIPVGG